ncbi:efflux RND transporter periplasmic adaptor subunit [Fusobacterium necrophorum]|uniref:Efflux RND transporter periplasmic adaptor subunit n=1 Tax=Fusobacterium necrophorum TaxID=859 RepID=A0A4Q2KUW1_9FUSO|nr:efflux RND transporter periplasmic adaptor subunit [Fusobacterium necrophorum]RXZ69338.1 efflux RND transporter periplasmic adaptor subunit [Fusobacterium necrophorum]
MTKKWISIFLISSFCFLSCGKKAEEERIRPVKIQEIGKESSEEIILEYPASIQAKQETVLSFQVAGKVENIFVNVGDFVKKGQILAKLEEQDYNLNMEANRQKFEASRAVAENAKLQFERVKTLYQNNAIAKKEYDMVLSQYKSAIAAEKANQAAFSHSQNEFQYGVLRASYDGFISKKMGEVGSVIAAGTPIFVLSSKEVSEVAIQVGSKDLEKIKSGKEFHFILDDDKTKHYPLHLKSVSSTPDMTKLSYPVLLELTKQEEKNLYAGMSGTVHVVLPKENMEEIRLPISAIFEENGSFVYLYGANNRVEKREVRLGELRGNGEIQILSGLKRGEKVIVAGVATIHEGQAVKPLPPKTDTNVGNLL